MAGTMSQADLVADLKASLLDAANSFTSTNDADFIRHLTIAALDLARFRPRTLLGSLSLVADQFAYSAPADIVATKYPIWGVNERNRNRQWDAGYPGKLPRLSLVGSEVHLTPAPSSAQISMLGSDYKFYYYAAHVIAADATQTTVRAGDRHLLLMRAAAEAMTELAHKGVINPVQLHRGLGSMPANSSPSAWARELLLRYEGAAT